MIENCLFKKVSVNKSIKKVDVFIGKYTKERILEVLVANTVQTVIRAFIAFISMEDYLYFIANLYTRPFKVRRFFYFGDIFKITPIFIFLIFAAEQ